jgi:membrane protein
LSEFFSDLRAIVGKRALKRVIRKVLEDDCPGLAGQLSYFILFSLFPFLMSVVALAGLVIDDPEAALKTLTTRMAIFLPTDIVGLLEEYIDRTLQEASAIVVFVGILVTLWSGSRASHALIKATNTAYGVQEGRSARRLAGIYFFMILGLALLIAALSLVVFSPRTGGFLQSITGFPDVLIAVWNVGRWGVGFLALTLALDVLYYVAPDAELPFRWITPGGFAATVLMLLSSVALSLYVGNFGRYDQLYGQVGTVVVLMLWLYIATFMVLIGIEINAVLARMAEERVDAEIVRSDRPADKRDA